MTLPYERTRSIIWTEEFLKELLRNPEVPEDIRQQAKTLLRHYPSTYDVFSLGRLEECLIGEGPTEEYRRLVIALHQPLLSSSLDT